MTKTIGEEQGWDKVEASTSFQERLGQERPDEPGAEAATADSEIDGADSAEMTDRLAMPDESLASEDLDGFREQLSEQLSTTDDDLE